MTLSLREFRPRCVCVAHSAVIESSRFARYHNSQFSILNFPLLNLPVHFRNKESIRIVNGRQQRHHTVCPLSADRMRPRNRFKLRVFGEKRADNVLVLPLQDGTGRVDERAALLYILCTVCKDSRLNLR